MMQPIKPVCTMINVALMKIIEVTLNLVEISITLKNILVLVVMNLLKITGMHMTMDAVGGMCHAGPMLANI